MRLSELKPEHEVFLRLERYLNDGSPSGFSERFMPGPGFRASETGEAFQLPIFDCSSLETFSVGEVGVLLPHELPVHPEMASKFARIAGVGVTQNLEAVATSSGRTLAVNRHQSPFFAKVSYQGLLGRVHRRMTEAHLLSAIEVSSAYERAIQSGALPRSFHIYRERYGLGFPNGHDLMDWGYVEREAQPFPDGHFIQVPAFSLIASGVQGSAPLIRQLFDRVPSLSTKEGFFSHFAQPILDLYFSSVSLLGLQPEVHAQNVVFLLTDELVPAGVALRDMESVDKDLPLMNAVGSSSEFTLTGYKFLLEDAYNYQIMHSFYV